MTLSTTTVRATVQGSGSAGPFSFPFKVFAATDLLVQKTSALGVVTALAYPTDYTVSGVGNASGGTLTLTVALAVGESLSILRAVPNTQPTSFRALGTFFPASHEDEFDRVTMLVQQNTDAIKRSARLASSIDPASISMELTPVTGQVLGWASPTQLSTFTLDSSAVGVPGGGRTVATATAYLANNAVVNVKDFGAKGDGATDDRAAINLAVTTAIAAGTGISFPPGTYRMASGLTIACPARFWPGAKIKPDSGVTVSLTAAIVAGIHQLFDLSAAGTVTVANQVHYLPEWWGAKGDRVTDDATALNAAFSNMSTNGGTVILSSINGYRIGSKITIRGGAGSRVVGNVGRTLIIADLMPINSVAVEVNSLYLGEISNLQIYGGHVSGAYLAGTIGLYVKGNPQPGTFGQGTVNTRFQNIAVQGFESNIQFGNFSGLTAGAGAADGADPDINTITLDAIQSTDCKNAVVMDGANILTLSWRNLYTGDVDQYHVWIKRSGELRVWNWTALNTRGTGKPKIKHESGLVAIYGCWSESSTDCKFLDASTFVARAPIILDHVIIGDTYTTETTSVAVGGTGASGGDGSGGLTLRGCSGFRNVTINSNVPVSYDAVDFAPGFGVVNLGFLGLAGGSNGDTHGGTHVPLGAMSKGVFSHGKLLKMNDQVLAQAVQIPYYGLWVVGDVVWLSNPTASASPGWYVVTAGGATNGAWAGTTAYTQPKWLHTSTGKVLELTTPGTSGSSEPNPTVIGNTVADGTCVWTYRAANRAQFAPMAALGAAVTA